MMITRLATNNFDTDIRIAVNSAEWRDFESMLDSELMPLDVHSLYGLMNVYRCIHENEDTEYVYLEDVLYVVGFFLSAESVDSYNYYLAGLQERGFIFKTITSFV